MKFFFHSTDNKCIQLSPKKNGYWWKKFWKMWESFYFGYLVYVNISLIVLLFPIKIIMQNNNQSSFNLLAIR